MDSSVKFIIEDKNMSDVKFCTKRCITLTDEELKMCSSLFSEHYGEWGEGARQDRIGKKITLRASYYRDTMCKDDHYVSLAYHNDELIGQAFYIRKNFGIDECMSWVLQLVVHSNYRRKNIGKTLLYSIWGFSGDSAWGLATSNPYTVKTLESATFRKVAPQVVKDNLSKIKKIGKEVSFIKKYKVDLINTVVDTEFYIDRSDIDNKIRNAYGSEWKLGKLPLGYEWLAFTFRDQQLRKFSSVEFNRWVEYSENKLKEAYSRMNTINHPWAKLTTPEVDFIIETLKLSGQEKIADFGCGIGRHCIEFLNRGYNILGIDFVHSNIERAKQCENGKINGKSSFLEADCRKVNLKNTYDVILCLYDVIGSFPDNKENEKLLKNIYKHLSVGGCAVISVMNMELTEKIAKYKKDILNDLKSLLTLKPSKTMQMNGNVFDPEHYIIDINSKLVYRKEQFIDDGNLSAEHVIRDKRYTKDEICNMVQKIGFKITDVRFVSAGKWHVKLNNTDRKAKEILLFLQK